MSSLAVHANGTDPATQNWLEKTEVCRRSHINKIVGAVALAIIGAAVGTAALVFVIHVTPLATALFVGMVIFGELNLLASLMSVVALPFLVLDDSSNLRNPKFAKPVVDMFCNHSLQMIHGGVNWSEQYQKCFEQRTHYIHPLPLPGGPIPLLSDQYIDTYARFGLVPESCASNIKDFAKNSMSSDALIGSNQRPIIMRPLSKQATLFRH